MFPGYNKLNKRQRARYNNALRIAKKINKLLDEGYEIFNEEGNRACRFSINEENGEISEILSDCCTMVWFIPDPLGDNGLYDTIKEFNESFRDWYYIHPKDRHKLFG